MSEVELIQAGQSKSKCAGKLWRQLLKADCWIGNVNNINVFTGTLSQMQNGWAFQDPNGSNDPGGCIIDFMLRINF